LVRIIKRRSNHHPILLLVAPNYNNTKFHEIYSYYCVIKYKPAEPAWHRLAQALVVKVYNTSLISTAWHADAASRMRGCGGARRSHGEVMVVVGADPVHKEPGTCPHSNFLFPKQIYLSLSEKRKFLIAKNRQETVF
jgi:hypothetical protein